MRLYVSGPMSNMPDHNFPAFREAALNLHKAGYDVIDPGAKGDLGWTWEEYLRYDLKLMLDCHGLAVLPGWRDSRGAKLEVYVADQLGLPVRSVDLWVAAAALGKGVQV